MDRGLCWVQNWMVRRQGFGTMGMDIPVFKRGCSWSYKLSVPTTGPTKMKQGVAETFSVPLGGDPFTHEPAETQVLRGVQHHQALDETVAWMRFETCFLFSFFYIFFFVLLLLLRLLLSVAVVVLVFARLPVLVPVLVPVVAAVTCERHGTALARCLLNSI